MVLIKYPKWTIYFLRYIDSLEKQINHTIYRIDIPTIISHYEEDGSSLSIKTAYKYTNYCKEQNLIEEHLNTVKRGTVFTREALNSSNSPLYYLTDLEGSEVLPNDIPKTVVILNGEKTLKSYILTSVGRKFLEEIKYSEGKKNHR